MAASSPFPLTIAAASLVLATHSSFVAPAANALPARHRLTAIPNTANVILLIPHPPLSVRQTALSTPCYFPWDPSLQSIYQIETPFAHRSARNAGRPGHPVADSVRRPGNGRKGARPLSGTGAARRAMLER